MASRSTTRATTARGTTRRVSWRSSASAGAGRGRAGADGRHDRQHQGRPGHWRERRARSDRHVWLARVAARARGGGLEQAISRRAARRMPRTRGRAASLREFARMCPVEFDPESLRYRGASRERCFELFTRLGFRTLVMEYAPTRRRSARTTAWCERSTSSTRSPPSFAAPGDSGSACCPTRPRRCARRSPASAFATATEQARYVPLGAPVSDPISSAIAIGSSRSRQCRRRARGVEGRARERSDRARSDTI